MVGRATYVGKAELRLLVSVQSLLDGNPALARLLILVLTPMSRACSLCQWIVSKACHLCAEQRNSSLGIAGGGGCAKYDSHICKMFTRGMSTGAPSKRAGHSELGRGR